MAGGPHHKLLQRGARPISRGNLEWMMRRVTYRTSLGEKAKAVQVDVRDAPSLSRVLRGARAVLNTVGPFFRYGPTVLRAAIDARVHSFDINDDWESTEAALDLDPAAREAGLTALIGVGASPGISNMLIARAMRELDRVEEIIAGFDLDAAMPEQRQPRPAAATIHRLHQLTGTIRVYENGVLQQLRSMQRVDIFYPGLATRPAWTMGHPEAITFPRYFPQLRAARVVMTTSTSARAASPLDADRLGCRVGRACGFMGGTPRGSRWGDEAGRGLRAGDQAGAPTASPVRPGPRATSRQTSHSGCHPSCCPAGRHGGRHRGSSGHRLQAPAPFSGRAAGSVSTGGMSRSNGVLR